MSKKLLLVMLSSLALAIAVLGSGRAAGPFVNPSWDNPNYSPAYESPGERMARLEEANPRYDNWVTLQALPGVLAHHMVPRGMDVAGSLKYFIFGGSTGGGVYVAQVLEYDVTGDAWTPKTSLPAARGIGGAAVVGDKVYVLGGTRSFPTGLNEVSIYHTDGDSFTTGANIPAAVLDMGVGVWRDSLIYVLGGGNWGTSPVNTVYMYDPPSNTWTSCTNLPTAIGCVSAGIIGDSIVVSTGYTAAGATNDTWIGAIDTATPTNITWTTATALPSGIRYRTMGAVHNNQLFVVGGNLDAGGVTAEAWSYDPRADTWNQWANKPTAVSNVYGASAGLDSLIYVAGGYPGTTPYVDDHEALNLSTLVVGAMDGVVMDLATVLPIQGAFVEASGYSDSTDASGYFFMDSVAAGTYDVTASAFGYNPDTVFGVQVLGNDTATVDTFWLTHPVISVDPTSFYVALYPDEMKDTTLYIFNTGNGPLDFDIEVFTAKGLGGRQPDTLHFDGPYDNNAIGLTAGGTYEGAIRLTPTELGPYAGWQIVSVLWYHHETGTHGDMVKIYSENTQNAPGPEITSEPTSATGPGWFRVDLSTPVPISGTVDRWVSVQVTHAAGEYPIGIDAGPAVAYKGDFIYFSGSWDELRNYGLDYNWNVRAIVDLSTSWLSASPLTGSVAAGDTFSVTVSFDATGLTSGLYTGELRIHNNSVDSLVAVPCTLEVLVGTEEVVAGPDLPKVYALSQNSPNPVNGLTAIAYQLPKESHVSLSVYDVSGRLVRTLANGSMEPGYYTAEWDAKDSSHGEVSSGVYFYRLTAGDFEATRKLVVLR